MNLKELLNEIKDLKECNINCSNCKWELRGIRKTVEALKPYLIFSELLSDPEDIFLKIVEELK